MTDFYRRSKKKIKNIVMDIECNHIITSNLYLNCDHYDKYIQIMRVCLFYPSKMRCKYISFNVDHAYYSFSWDIYFQHESEEKYYFICSPLGVPVTDWRNSKVRGRILFSFLLYHLYLLSHTTKLKRNKRN